MIYTMVLGDRDAVSTTTYVDPDPAFIGPNDVFLADEPQFGWDLPSEWPCQPSPVEARFTMIGPVVDPLLDVGSVVGWLIEQPGSEVVVEFYGRVTDMTATPIRYTLLDGTTIDGQSVDVIAVDYLADLGELQFDPTAVQTEEGGFLSPVFWLQSYPFGFFGDYSDPLDPIPPAVLYPPHFPDGIPAILFTPPAADLDVIEPTYLLRTWTSEPTVLEAIKDVLRQTPRDDPAGLIRGGVRYMGILGANVTDGLTLDTDTPLTVDFPPNRTTDVATEGELAFPLQFADSADGWGLSSVAAGATGWVIDADRIEYDGTKWTRTKWGNPNRARLNYTATGGVEAVYEQDSIDRDAADLVSVVEVEAKQVPDAVHAARLAPVYLPEQDPRRDRWGGDTFTYRPDLDAVNALTPSWFPRPSADLTGEDRQSHLSRTVLIHSIPRGSTPLDREWYAGQLRSVRMTFADGGVEVEFSLRRSWTFPTSDDPALTPEDVGAMFGAPTVGDLDPRFTVYDYRLARGTI